MIWITFALGGGYTAANVLKWHWWRFNGYGYFWGMLAGMLAGRDCFPTLLEPPLPRRLDDLGASQRGRQLSRSFSPSRWPVAGSAAC